jgi:hypothetical protein
MVVQACHPSYGGKHKIEGWQSSLAYAKSKTLSKTIHKKITRDKRAGIMAQIVGHLPSKHGALSSNASTKRKKEAKQRITEILYYTKDQESSF